MSAVRIATSDRYETVRRLFASGRSVDEIADEVALGRVRVWCILRKLELITPKYKQGRLRGNEHEVIRLFRGGMTQAAIARQMRVTQPYIHQICKRAGLTRNDGGCHVRAGLGISRSEGGAA